MSQLFLYVAGFYGKDSGQVTKQHRSDYEKELQNGKSGMASEAKSRSEFALRRVVTGHDAEGKSVQGRT